MSNAFVEWHSAGWEVIETRPSGARIMRNDQKGEYLIDASRPMIEQARREGSVPLNSVYLYQVPASPSPSIESLRRWADEYATELLEG